VADSVVLRAKEGPAWFCVRGLSGADFRIPPGVGVLLRWVGRLSFAHGADGLSEVVGVRARARFALGIVLMGGLTLAISACGGDKGASLGERVIPLGQPVPKGGGRYLVGQPYEIAGQSYEPREDPSYDRTGQASWYGELFHGRRTANGEIYDMDRLSAAHPTLPLPVYAQVTNLQNGRSVVVRVNDRGPFKHDRIIDLSRRSADVLGFRRSGTAPVRVKYLRRAPLSGDDSYERQYLANLGLKQFAVAPRAKPGSPDPIATASLPGGTTPPLPERVERSIAAASLQNPEPGASGTVATSSWETMQASPDSTGSIAPLAQKPSPVAPAYGPAIQAGSFKNRDNAERARVKLGGIAPVEVDAIEVGGETFYRVRVGPFRDEIEAAAALSGVSNAGYHGAKIVMRN
jgi:peptidoglycan lytic transglycosylase